MNRIKEIRKQLGSNYRYSRKLKEKEIQELKRHIPTSLVAPSHYWLLLHGRYTCTARKPHCLQCGLASICRSKDKNIRIVSATEERRQQN